jgi:hypothetical protein
MQYQHAIRLGALHQTLGIQAEARVLLQITPQGAHVWDVDAGNTYDVVQDGDRARVIRGQRAVPAHVTEIIAATDGDLKHRWVTTMGWDEVRETIFCELSYRGVDILHLDLHGE